MTGTWTCRRCHRSRPASEPKVDDRFCRDCGEARHARSRRRGGVRIAGGVADIAGNMLPPAPPAPAILPKPPKPGPPEPKRLKPAATTAARPADSDEPGAGAKAELARRQAAARRAREVGELAALMRTPPRGKYDDAG